MTTLSKPAPPWYSGFCGLRLGPASHGRCNGQVHGLTCACPCHKVPTAADFLIPDPPAGHSPWREASPEEWQAAERAGTPTAYVEWVASEDVAMTAHFVAEASKG